MSETLSSAIRTHSEVKSEATEASTAERDSLKDLIAAEMAAPDETEASIRQAWLDRNEGNEDRARSDAIAHGIDFDRLSFGYSDPSEIEYFDVDDLLPKTLEETVVIDKAVLGVSDVVSDAEKTEAVAGEVETIEAADVVVPVITLLEEALKPGATKDDLAVAIEAYGETTYEGLSEADRGILVSGLKALNPQPPLSPDLLKGIVSPEEFFTRLGEAVRTMPDEEFKTFKDDPEAVNTFRSGLLSLKSTLAEKEKPPNRENTPTQARQAVHHLNMFDKDNLNRFFGNEDRTQLSQKRIVGYYQGGGINTITAALQTFANTAKANAEKAVRADLLDPDTKDPKGTEGSVEAVTDEALASVTAIGGGFTESSDIFADDSGLPNTIKSFGLAFDLTDQLRQLNQIMLSGKAEGISEAIERFNAQALAKIEPYAKELDGLTNEQFTEDNQKAIRNNVANYVKAIPEGDWDTGYPDEYIAKLKEGKIDISYQEYLDEFVLPNMGPIERIFFQFRGFFASIGKVFEALDPKKSKASKEQLEAKQRAVISDFNEAPWIKAQNFVALKDQNPDFFESLNVEGLDTDNFASYDVLKSWIDFNKARPGAGLNNVLTAGLTLNAVNELEGFLQESPSNRITVSPENPQVYTLRRKVEGEEELSQEVDLTGLEDPAERGAAFLVQLEVILKEPEEDLEEKDEKKSEKEKTGKPAVDETGESRYDDGPLRAIRLRGKKPEKADDPGESSYDEYGRIVLKEEKEVVEPKDPGSRGGEPIKVKPTKPVRKIDGWMDTY